MTVEASTSFTSSVRNASTRLTISAADWPAPIPDAPFTCASTRRRRPSAVGARQQVPVGEMPTM
jgi:hypothetical protein